MFKFSQVHPEKFTGPILGLPFHYLLELDPLPLTFFLEFFLNLPNPQWWLLIYLVTLVYILFYNCVTVLTR